MNYNDDVLSGIISKRLIAIIRLKESNQISEIIGTLVRAGINAIEITTNTPDWCDELESARKIFPNDWLGAGTVTTVGLAKMAVDSGAQFIVTPNTDEKVIQFCKDSSIPIFVGALTPTEIASAVACGADIIKLFPAKTLGEEYLRAILGPFDQVKVFPVGGIDLSNMNEWIAAGASGFGLGSSLVPSDQKAVNLTLLGQKAKQYVEFLNTAAWIN